MGHASAAQPGTQAPSIASARRTLDPHAKQKAGAANLGYPFCTYRHRLRRAHEDIAAELWALATAPGRGSG